jgi:hypothetical protein
MGDALDRQVAGELDDAVGVDVDVRGAEGDLRVVGGVEELLGEHVGAELLRSADGDRLDLGGALELAVDERRGDLVERALEERDALITDGEAEVGVDRIGVVRTGERAGRGAHGMSSKDWS